MSLLQKFKTVIGSESSLQVNLYKCQDCGNEFESMKDLEKAKCMDCLSTDLTDLGHPE